MQYNFGVVLYQEKEHEKALEWLIESQKVRENLQNPKSSKIKSAKTARAIGACNVELGRLDEAIEYDLRRPPETSCTKHTIV